MVDLQCQFCFNYFRNTIFWRSFWQFNNPCKNCILDAFPSIQKFRYASFITAAAHVLLYIVTSFGLVYAVKFFVNYGILTISLPTTLSFLVGVLYFVKLEKQAGTYPKKGKLQSPQIVEV